jgi:toxin ParE1/3/4
MARVVVTEPADADAADILTYLAREAGSVAAVKYSRAFDALYQRLASHPDSGAARPALGSHIRIGIVLPYVVIYRHVAGDHIVAILRIVHGNRRITRKLLDRAP